MPPSPTGTHRKLLSGNEAVAHAAWEAGVHVACGYPGTPSTEILETLSHFLDVKCEWSTNEKVALEIAIGASFAGARSLVTMKHVGLNVAADPFFSAAYTGVKGGVVIVSADDPGMHSSQNEQDNRLLAAAARIPILEPSSSQEARDFVIAAFDLSEKFDTPVMLRITTRIAHGKAVVEIGNRKNIRLKPYQKDPSKNILLPSNSRKKHKRIETVQMPHLKKEASRWAHSYEGSDVMAFITSGPSFYYVREAFPDAAVLKIGMTYPLPDMDILAFAKNKKRIIVVEELEPFMEQKIASLGVVVEGKCRLPRFNELSVDILRKAISQNYTPLPTSDVVPLPPRPPVMCPGCSHRGTFYALKQLNSIVAGDVGCYTLGALAPLGAIDCSINMGASISMAHGMEKVMDEHDRNRLVSVIGDSTFFHSGIAALVNVLYNNGNGTTIVLDNHTSAMTGHQNHPGSGEGINGAPARKIDIEAFCKSLGIASVRRSDPYNLLDTLRTIDEELHHKEPSVIIAEAPCALKSKQRFAEPLTLDASKCTQCFACTQIGCPAIELEEDHLHINPLLCVSCGHCRQVCSDCNAGLDIPLILEMMHQSRYKEAFDVVLRDNPFPAVSARVCPRPCEHEINALGHFQEQIRADQYPDLVNEFPKRGNSAALSIHGIERFLGGYGIANVNGSEFAPKQEYNDKVAVIGAGPSGLSAAWYLRRFGYHITVFDANAEPGGMLRYGIPSFRLPRDILDAEINRLKAIGIGFRCGTKFEKEMSLKKMENTYDAVVLAIGNAQPKLLNLKDTEKIKSGLSNAIAFLRDFNSDRPMKLEGKVGVIGGGNTAIDCARSAKRLGADVTIYYRRGENNMSASRSEIDEAIKEGVQFEYWTTPVQVLSKAKTVTGLVLAQTRPETLRHLFEVSAEEFAVQLNHIIFAVGEETEKNLIEELGVSAAHGIDVNFMGVTPQTGIFGCGDAAINHGTVTQAISTGKRTAESVNAFLQTKKCAR